MADKRLLFVVNVFSFFLSHRLPVALAAKDAGYDVHVAGVSAGEDKLLRSHGLTPHPIHMARSSLQPLEELLSLRQLLRLYRKLNPDIVHHVTIKPVLYGTIAARIARVPAVVNAVSGLGFVFLAKGARATLRRAGVRSAYRTAIRHANMRVIFQNDNDRDDFLHRRMVRERDCRIIRGSGVDLDLFRPRPEAVGIPVVLLPARLLFDKGVGEFISAAQILRREGVAARFVLVGDIDSGNPAHVPETTVRNWVQQGLAEWSGYRIDMASAMGEANIVCLPSYREGLPKVLVEAAAAGRAIVTTDVPGCRDVVTHEANGLLVPPSDATALAQALKRLIMDPALRRAMGEAGRSRAVIEFDVRRVVAQHLEIYAELHANHA